MGFLNKIPKPVLYFGIAVAVIAAVLILGDFKAWVER